MKINSIHIRNFRRLKDVRIDLDVDTSIFVGSNNSGKTSAAQIFQAFFAAEKGKFHFSVYDFSADCWAVFNTIGSSESPSETSLPSIGLDIWFDVSECDLYYVVDLLPSLDWDNTLVGVRMEFAPKDPTKLLENFREAKAAAQQYAVPKKANEHGFHPWPETLTDYLKRRLSDEYKIFYYVLDRSAFDEKLVEKPGYVPSVLGDAKEKGASVMRSLLRVDFLTAQRHQVDSESSGKASNLSKRLNEIYKHSLKKNDGGFKAVAALAESEAQLNDHMAVIFGPTLKELSKLGYPGFADPHLVIKSALNPETILTENTGVHYALRDPGKVVATDTPLTLPDKYNGLGFKNLIYMVIEVLEAHRRWVDEEEDRPPLHLIIIEEPEAHLHVQLQQVFVRKIRELLPSEGPSFSSQLIVTTHSSHIVYDSGFAPIRYFRRLSSSGAWNYSNVLNLSKLRAPEGDARQFLLQYMKLTHCDLFFADAAVLVEGNVERLLLPLMIEQVAPRLKASYLSIVEVGGAFAYRFKDLIEFLGLTTLVITDLDSVHPLKPRVPKVSNVVPDGIVAFVGDQIDDDDDDDESVGTQGRGVCMVDTANAVTSNQTLVNWLPRMNDISELLTAAAELKAPIVPDADVAKVRVAFQTRHRVTWLAEVGDLAGRTFEEAFAFENLTWCQKPEQRLLHLRVVTNKGPALTLAEVTKKIHERIKGSSFDKTAFALALIMKDPTEWKPPAYVMEGLHWLSEQLFPIAVISEPVPAEDVEVAP